MLGFSHSFNMRFSIRMGHKIPIFAIINLLLIHVSVAGLLPHLKPDFEINLLRTDPLKVNKDDLYVDFSQIRIRRFERELSCEGNFTFRAMDNTFTHTIDVFYSASGTGKYAKMPIGLFATPVCDFFKTTFRVFIQPMLANNSNFPAIPPEGTCPTPEGNFWMKGVTIKTEELPPHVPRGFYRVEIRFKDKEKRVVGGLTVHLNIKSRN